MRSSRMSPSGCVITRLVNDCPAAVVVVETMLAPTSRSFAFVVVIEPLLLDVPLPELAATTSSGLAVARPRYSAIRISGCATEDAQRTVTVFAPADADRILAA